MGKSLVSCFFDSQCINVISDNVKFYEVLPLARYGRRRCPGNAGVGGRFRPMKTAVAERTARYRTAGERG